MQQAKRWRRRQPATWQVVLARWFLALAVILLISPSVTGPYEIARAQDRTDDDTPVERAQNDQDSRPEHQAPDDSAARPAVPKPTLVPIFSPNVRDAPITTSQDQPATRQDAPVTGQNEPGTRQTDPSVPAELPDQTTGNRRAPRTPRPEHTAFSSCPADQGVAKGASFGP